MDAAEIARNVNVRTGPGSPRDVVATDYVQADNGIWTPIQRFQPHSVLEIGRVHRKKGAGKKKQQKQKKKMAKSNGDFGFTVPFPQSAGVTVFEINGVTVAVRHRALSALQVHTGSNIPFGKAPLSGYK